MLSIVLVLLACQGPLGDRHDLEGLRIAAVEVRPSPAAVTARAAVVVDGRLFSDVPVDRHWYWTEATEEAVLEAGGGPDAIGPRVEMLRDPLRPRLVLVVAHEGEERRAFFDPGEADLSLPTLAVASVDASFVAGQDASVEAREDWSTEPGLSVIDTDDIVRLSLDTEARVRWMQTATHAPVEDIESSPYGTFLELDAQTTDWTAETVVLDEDTVDEVSPGQSGSRAVLALALRDGASRFLAFDLEVGEPVEGLWVGGRKLPAPVSTPGRYTGIFVEDDGPLGLALEDVEPAAPNQAPFSLPCGDGGAFDPDWLVDGHCTRAQLVGQSILVEAP